MKSPYHYGAQRKGEKRSIKTFKVNSIFRSEPSDRDPYESIILLSRAYSFSGDDQKVMLKNLIWFGIVCQTISISSCAIKDHVRTVFGERGLVRKLRYTVWWSRWKLNYEFETIETSIDCDFTGFMQDSVRGERGGFKPGLVLVLLGIMPSSAVLDSTLHPDETPKSCNATSQFPQPKIFINSSQNKKLKGAFLN